MTGSARDAVELYAPFLSRSAAAVAADLERFAALLAKWQRIQNLVSRETLGELWSRHVADSLQVLRFFQDTDIEITDIGSGGGFPAIPLAIATVGQCSITMIEPNGRKAAFLRTVSRELGLGASVLDERVESVNPQGADQSHVLTARAVAPLPKLLELVKPQFGPKTRGLFHKGREHVEEIAEASHFWSFDVLIHQSDVDADGVLLEIFNLRSKTAR